MGTVTRDVPLVKWFNELGIEDVPLVGGKNASLGEMYRELAPKGVKVPNGFAVTAEAYRLFLKEAKLDATIRSIVKDLDTHDLTYLQQRGNRRGRRFSGPRSRRSWPTQSPTPTTG